MDFGLVLGVVIVVAVAGYIWMSRTPTVNEEEFPSDCSVDTKPDVNPADPPKAAPVLSRKELLAKPMPSAAQQPEPAKLNPADDIAIMLAEPEPSAVEDAAVAKAEAAAPKPKKAKAKAPAMTREEAAAMTKKQLDEFALTKGIELDRRKKKADMIDDLLDQLK